MLPRGHFSVFLPRTKSEQMFINVPMKVRVEILILPGDGDEIAFTDLPVKARAEKIISQLGGSRAGLVNVPIKLEAEIFLSPSTRSGVFSTPLYKERLQVISLSTEKGSTQKDFGSPRKISYEQEVTTLQEGFDEIPIEEYKLENTSGEISHLTKQIVAYADQVKKLKNRLHRQQEMFHNEKHARTVMEQRAEAAEKSADCLEARAKNAEARAKVAIHTVETTKNRCRDLGILCSYQAVKVRELATMINLFLNKLEEQREKTKVKHRNPFVKCSSPVYIPTYANTEDATSVTTSSESAFGSNQTNQGKGRPNPCKQTGCHSRVKIGMESQVVRPMLHPMEKTPHRTPTNILPSKGDPPKKKNLMHSTSKIKSKKSTGSESPRRPFKTTHSQKDPDKSKRPISETPTPRDCPRLPFKAVPSITDHSSCSPKTSTTLTTSRSNRSTRWPLEAHKKENPSPPQLQPKHKSPQKENNDTVVKTIQKVPLLPLKSVLSRSPRNKSYSAACLSVSRSPSQSDSRSVSFRSNNDTPPGFRNYSDLHQNNFVVRCRSGNTKEKEETLTSKVSEGSLSSIGGEELVVYQGSTCAGKLESLKSSSKNSQPTSIENTPEADNKQIDGNGIVGQVSMSPFEEAFGDQHCEPSPSLVHLHGSINQLRSAFSRRGGSDIVLHDQISPSIYLQLSSSTTKSQSRGSSPNSDYFSQQESSTDLSHADEYDPKDKPCLLDPSTTYKPLKPAVLPVVAHPTPENVGTSLEIVLYNPDVLRISSHLLPQTHVEGEDNKIVPLSMKLCSNPPSRIDPRFPPPCVSNLQSNCGSPSDHDQLQMVVYKHPTTFEQDINPNALAQRISPGCDSPIYNNLLQAKNLNPPTGSPEISETSPVVSRDTSPRGPHHREIGWNRLFSRSGLSSRKASPRTLDSFVTTQPRTLISRIRGGGVNDIKPEIYDFESAKHLPGLLELKNDYDGQGSRENGLYSHREQKGNVHLHFQVLKGYHSYQDHKGEHDGENCYTHNDHKKGVLHLNLNNITKQVESRHRDNQGMIVTTPRLSLRLNTVQEGFFKEDERRTVIEQRADELSKTCAYQAKKLAEVAHQLQQFPIRLVEQLRRWAALEAKSKYEDRVQAVAQKRIGNYEEIKLSPTNFPSCDAVIQAETPRSIRQHLVEDRLLDQLKVVRMMKAVADVRVTFLKARLKKLEAKFKHVCEIPPTPYKSEVDVWRCGSRFLVQLFLFGLGFSTLSNILGGISSFPSPT